MKSTNPTALRGKPLSGNEHQVSSFAVDQRALHYIVNDTVVETRGLETVWRPPIGECVRLLFSRTVVHR